MNVNITIRFKAISKNEFFTEFSQAIRMWNSIYGYNYYGYNGILSLEDYFKGQWWLVYILIKWCLMIFFLQHSPNFIATLCIFKTIEISCFMQNFQEYLIFAKDSIPNIIAGIFE